MCGGKQSRRDRKYVLRAVILMQEVLVFRVVLFQGSPRLHLPADPSMHGEISGLHRCTEVLTERGLSPQEILAAWRDFTMCAFLLSRSGCEGSALSIDTPPRSYPIDTTGEPCPMVRSSAYSGRHMRH
jgi:tRNA(Arg) A34 adenosine deaminase TadA